MELGKLPNKPLVEAILELRLALPQDSSRPGAANDPEYRVQLLRFLQSATTRYPALRSLDAASIPDQIVPHIVQYQLRVGEGSWPLIQIGPGVLTVNDTAGYAWEDFRARCNEAVTWYFQSRVGAPLPTAAVVLRYVNAIEFDHRTQDPFGFLKEQMNLVLEPPTTLFEDTGVDRLPSALMLQASFPSSRPQGTATVKIAVGEKSGKPALIWELMIGANDREIPSMPDGFADWLEAAHGIPHDWFFKLTCEALQRRFRGD